MLQNVFAFRYNVSFKDTSLLKHMKAELYMYCVTSYVLFSYSQLHAYYAYRVINGGKSKNNEDQATSKQFFIKKKSDKNRTVQQDIPLAPLTDEEPVSNLSE